MSTFSMKVHELLGLRTPVDRQTSLNVFEIDSKSPRRVERGSKQQIPSASSQDRWMVETATALAEFAVTAQMRGLGVDRKTALDSMRLALESLCIGTDAVLPTDGVAAALELCQPRLAKQGRKST
jgi:hypothetical protein